MKLMIVDDNRGVREIIRDIVSDLTQEIFECADGHEAYATFDRCRPDWVVMDLDMVLENGIDLTRRLTGHFPGARILIVTTHGEPEVRAAAIEAGAMDLVLKENMLAIRGFLNVT